VASCCECGDEPSGSCAVELVSWSMCQSASQSVSRSVGLSVCVFVS
jgi:hypothetical protein